MQGGERGEEQEEQRDDACETHEVKTAEAYLRQRVPAAKRGGGDEEAGDGEKDLHSALPIPDEKFEWRGNVRGVGNAGEKQTHVVVIHEDEKDGQAAEKIDAIETCQRRRSDWRGWRGHEVIMRQGLGRSGGREFSCNEDVLLVRRMLAVDERREISPLRRPTPSQERR